jgi:hypothetical protein
MAREAAGKARDAVGAAAARRRDTAEPEAPEG